MAQYIELDSTHRDREVYPNPHEYELQPSQVNTWSRSGFAAEQTVRYSVKVLNVIVPYVAGLKDNRRLYLDIHSNGLDDNYKVRMIEGVNADAKFVIILDKILNDSSDNPAWIQYKCDMTQSLRINFHNTFSVRIFDKDGVSIPNGDNLYPASVLDTAQTSMTIELTPLDQTQQRVDVY